MAHATRPRPRDGARSWYRDSQSRTVVEGRPSASAVARIVAPLSSRTTASPIVSTVSKRRSNAGAGSKLWVRPHDRQRRRSGESLIAFINGQTGTDNVQRQGENAAILDNESPLNILEDVPNNGGQFNYSPMWDIHFLQWNASVPVANRLRQTDFATAAALVPAKAQSIAPDGNPSNTFQATGFIVNCPLISIFANA